MVSKYNYFHEKFTEDSESLHIRFLRILKILYPLETQL